MRGGESLFGWRDRIRRALLWHEKGRGVRGRGAQGKIPVFEMLKRGDRVYTQIVKNCSISELMLIIRDKAEMGATLYSDGFRTYDGLADYGYKRYYRINHGNNEFAKGHNHINWIENFLGIL